MDWIDQLRANLLNPTVMAAALVLVGVVITAVVTSVIAKRNRISIERTADDRLEAERKQKALDRSFADRARTYLGARAWLRAYEDVGRVGMLDPIWETEWDEPFRESCREEHLNLIEIYGTTNARRFFEATADAFAESCRATAFAWSMLEQRKRSQRELLADSPHGQYIDADLQLRQSEANTRGQDYFFYGRQLFEQFTRLCQDDLADTDQTDEELAISPIDRSRNAQIARQRRRKLEGLPIVKEGELEVEDWGD